MSLNYHRQYNLEIRNWLLKVFEYAGTISKEELVNRVCPVCGSTGSRFLANNDFFDYVSCCHCTLVYMNPSFPADRVNEGFKGDDELVMEYFNIILKYKTGLPPRPDPLTDHKLKDIYAVKQWGKLLDVGCSLGDFLHKAKYFYEVEGVEVNPLTRAVTGNFFKVHEDYLSNLGLTTEYDIVTLNQILYGVPDPVTLLKDIHAVLREDGILYINTPNADSYAMQLYKGRCNHLYGYTTQNVFNRLSLEKAAELTGFKIKSFRTEWLDIYVTDILLFLDKPEEFIHKKNPQFEGYESRINIEEEMHKRLDYKLGERGNYLVAVLEKV